MKHEVTEIFNVNFYLSDGNICVLKLVSNIFLFSYYDHTDGAQRVRSGRGIEQPVVIRT